MTDLPEKFFHKSNSPKESRMIQEKLFKLGYSWITSGQTYNYLEELYIVGYTDEKALYWRSSAPRNAVEICLIKYRNTPL